MLTLSGTLQSTVSNVRLFNFAGAGNILVSGTIVNGTGGGTVGVFKDGAGTSTFSNANTYSGGTTVNLGQLTLSATGSTLGTGNVTLANTTGVILSLGNNTAIGDAATLTFGTNSAIAMNGTGIEALGAITNSVTSITLIAANATQGTYSASDINTYFGVTSFSSNNGELFAFTPVPEPATYLSGLLLVGVAGAGLLRRWLASVS